MLYAKLCILLLLFFVLVPQRAFSGAFGFEWGEPFAKYKDRAEETYHEGELVRIRITKDKTPGVYCHELIFKRDRLVAAILHTDAMPISEAASVCETLTAQLSRQYGQADISRRPDGKVFIAWVMDNEKAYSTRIMLETVDNRAAISWAWFSRGLHQ